VRVRQDSPLRQMRELQDTVLQALASERRRSRQGGARAAAWRPPMDLAVSADEYVLLLDLPGVTREQIEATVYDGVLRIRGVSQQPEDVSGATEIRAERPTGQFTRAVHLPTDADLNKISAKLTDGVLEVRVGRRGPQSSRIEIAIGQ